MNTDIYNIDFLPTFFLRESLSRLELFLFQLWGATIDDLVARVVEKTQITKLLHRTLYTSTQRAHLEDGFGLGGLPPDYTLGSMEYWGVLVVMKNKKKFSAKDASQWELLPAFNLLFRTRKVVDLEKMVATDPNTGRMDPLPTPQDIPDKDSEFIYHDPKSPFRGDTQPTLQAMFQLWPELMSYKEEDHPLHRRRVQEENDLKASYIRFTQAQGSGKPTRSGAPAPRGRQSCGTTVSESSTRAAKRARLNETHEQDSPFSQPMTGVSMFSATEEQGRKTSLDANSLTWSPSYESTDGYTSPEQEAGEVDIFSEEFDFGNKHRVGTAFPGRVFADSPIPNPFAPEASTYAQTDISHGDVLQTNNFGTSGIWNPQFGNSTSFGQDPSSPEDASAFQQM